MLQRIGYKDKACAQIAQHYLDSPFNALVDLLPQVSKWQRALDALTQLKEAPLTGRLHSESRMVWVLSLDGNRPLLEP